MDISEFKAGTWRRGNHYRYFLPEKINHSFAWTDEGINEMLEAASLKLGELNSFSRFVPDPDMFIKMHVIKEAVTSSRIEGTRTNIEEAVVEEREIDPEKRDDWREVNNYVTAMNTAIEELKTLPLSNRLIRNTHRILLSNGRGEHKTPGEFRQSQNWIGGASLADALFVPPAHTLSVRDYPSVSRWKRQNRAIADYSLPGQLRSIGKTAALSLRFLREKQGSVL
jgi:Fic family protein